MPALSRAMNRLLPLILALAAGAPSLARATATPDPATRPPPALQRLESSAEDMGDAAASGGWSKAQAIVQRATQDVRSLSRRLGAAALSGASRDLQAALRAVRARRGLEAQFAANALSRDVVELYADYRTTVPLDVMRLDVLLRQVQLETRAGNDPQASAALNEAQAAWARLLPTLPSGAPAVARFEGELQEVAASMGDARATTRATDAALEGVDGLETLYTRQR